MTNAVKQYGLSKLDLFTPNRLHPELPALAHGEYPVMGGVATSMCNQCGFYGAFTNSSVIYEPDLIVRRDHIHSFLGLLDRPNNSTARKRIRRHDLLMMHMELGYSAAHKIWYRNTPPARKEGVGKMVRKSMETRESRDAFVRDVLASEQASLRRQGASEETAIELD